ncbi:DUF4253 domain-containing protein [Streptomyces sp. NPDC054787]
MPERMSSPASHDAPARSAATDPDELAAEYAQVFFTGHPQSRLGLAAAASGAEALAVAGWCGPLHYDNDTANFSAVIHDWERRFGVRVVAVGFATLHLSVAAPPMKVIDALLVAAKHFAFCPDHVWQGSRPYTLAAYAERVIGAHSWDFWGTDLSPPGKRSLAPWEAIFKSFVSPWSAVPGPSSRLSRRRLQGG